MAAPIDAAAGLVRAFAEVWLLPDLLALAVPGDGPPHTWIDLLDEEGFNTDHVEDVDLPDGPGLPTIMAEDAWRLVEWLELVGPDGLTDAGNVVASVADFAPERRTEQVWFQAHAVLADQVTELYRGADGTPITSLVQAGARALEQASDPWAPYCLGLLLVEFEALIHLAHTNPQRGRSLLGQLTQNRVAAMRDTGSPLRGVVRYLNMEIHADAVSTYYLDVLTGAVDDTVFTVTAAQATAILFVFCGLLEVPEPELPVQVMVAPVDG